jgi:hypothetical protein
MLFTLKCDKIAANTGILFLFMEKAPLNTNVSSILESLLNI